MNQEKEYGCTVCKHRDKCDYTPFGICKDYEREENEDGKAV